MILAGGRSTRFGSEKAVALVDGQPMIARVAAVLTAGGAPLAVNAPEASAAAAWARERGLPMLPDPPDAPDGPLAGVLAGLEWAQTEGADLLLTAPCDMPYLPEDMTCRLVEALAAAPAVAASTPDGSHPLCAVWRVDLVPRLRETLAYGHPSVRAWLGEAGAATARFPDARAFANVNAPQRPSRRPHTALRLTGIVVALLFGVALSFWLLMLGISDPLASDPQLRERQMLENRIALWMAPLVALLTIWATLRLARRTRGR